MHRRRRRWGTWTVSQISTHADQSRHQVALLTAKDTPKLWNYRTCNLRSDEDSTQPTGESETRRALLVICCRLCCDVCGIQDRRNAPRIYWGRDPTKAAYREAVQLRSSPYLESGMLCASKITTTWSGLEVPPVRKTRDNGRA